MKIKFYFFFTSLLAFILLFGCKSEVNSPDGSESLTDQLSYQTVDNDLALLKGGGMPLDSAAGVFSIGWDEIFRPIEDTSEVRGMAFAVAFGEQGTDLLHFRRFGLDMGDVFINYSGNHIQMHKKFHEMRGVAYDLFERPFGGCNPENLLQFIPNTEYQFEVTGSEVFAPITFSLTSPNALMDITSPTNGEVIDPTQDLTINWEGGNEGKVALRLMPHLRPPEGGHHGRHGEPPQPPPPMDRVIFVILDNNPGTYTFTAAQIQELLNGIQTDGLMAEVSQMDFGEVQHQNGMLQTAMRNGNSVMLRILQ
jgi:hypothetical protein